MQQTQAGFTLIELVAVVGISVILTLSAAALFLTFLVTNTRSNAIQAIRQEGNFALSQMSFLLRNAVSLEPNSSDVTCEADMTEIVLKSYDGGTTTFFAEEDEGIDKIASNSGSYLTTERVTLVEGPEFDCDTESNYVSITFSLRKGTPNADPDKEIVEETFTTGVNLRSVQNN